MKFFHDRGLGHLFVVALALTLAFPLLNLYLIYPQYQAQMLQTVQHEARNVAHHLSRMVSVDANRLLVDFNLEAEPFLLQDFKLLEIQVLDKTGRVVYSTAANNVGTVNQHDSFREVVAQGREFTTVLTKEEESAAGGGVSRDIVETYLPIMEEGSFVGAVGLYYDISNHQREFRRIFQTTFLTPAPFVLMFLALVGFVLKRLDAKILERERDKEEIEAQRNVLLVEQKRHGELLRQVENAKRQWEATMDRVDDMVIVTDLDLRIRRCNKAVCAFSGVAFAEILNQRLPDLFPGLDIDQSAANSGKAFEYCHQASDRWLYVTMYKTSDGEGLVITVHDLTEMKTITAELEQKNLEILEASQQLQAAIDEISGLIQRVVTEQDFGVYFKGNFPERCSEVMGCGKEECPFFSKDAGRCWHEVGTFCGGKVQGEFAKKYQSCATCKYFKRITANPINMIGEQFNNMMRILEGKNRELQTAYSELKQAQSHLLQQEKMASIGQLAAGVAHEINNPVGFISSNLGSLRKYAGKLADYIQHLDDLIHEVGPAELVARQAAERKRFKVEFILTDIDDLVRESLEGCGRVTKIVQDLKSFSRVDQAQEQTVDIHECIDSTINIVWNELKYKVKIEKEYQATRPLRCFPQQLNQVFMNLLVNAAHAIDKEGVISIRTWEDEAALSVAIRDTGSGIPPENIGHVFEPFFTTKEVGKGTGLGLSIVYDIVTKNHHGDIQVVSQVGQGTTFTVKLPFREEGRK